MTSIELSSEMNMWKASITNQRRRELSNTESFKQIVQSKIAQNQPPTAVDKLESYTLSAMKLKTFDRILHEMDVLNAFLDEICQKHFSQDAISAASYLMAMTMLDPQDLSKQSMKKIFKKIKIEQPISDHNALICYGKLKPSEEDVIAVTEALAAEVKDSKGLLIAVLMGSPKYKPKIILLQQLRKNGFNPGNNNTFNQSPPPMQQNAFFIPQPGMPQPQSQPQPNFMPPPGPPTVYV